ncbi:MAG TPA: transglycosylase SLT domain-containing protein [bacterium]|nr:transglycosylase SLT domain-containing protein [bacterium]
MKIKQKFSLSFFITIFFFLPLIFQSVNSSPSPIQEKIESLRQVIKETENLYNQAVIAYEEGKIDLAENLYKRALKKLAKANLDAVLNYQLKEEYDNLFGKMDVLLEEMERNSKSILDVSKEELKGTENLEAEKIKENYTIPIDIENSLAKEYIRLYTKGKRRKAIAEALERSGRYREMIFGVLEEYDLPRELVYLPVVESLYKVNAYSRARAVGLWQLMETPARNLGLVINYWIDERRDPEKATRAALKFLKDLHAWFNDWHLALAAYNRGQSGIGRDLKFSKAVDFNQLVERKALPKETENFVPKFMACVSIGENYQEYGFPLNFEEPLNYDEIVLDKVIDLEVIAKCVGTTEAKIKKLNPALRAWCTPKNYPNFKLKLPPGTKERFLTNVAEVKDLTPGRGLIRYKVKKGDILGIIAREYYTTVYAIKRDNNIKNINKIRTGQLLIIRPGRKYFRE